MEKEMNHENGKVCGWCGMDNKGFSGKRLMLSILIGIFIFLLGIQIGEMRDGGYGRHPMYMGRGMEYRGQWIISNDLNDQYGQGDTTTVVMPAQPSTPTAPAGTTTAPAPKQ